VDYLRGRPQAIAYIDALDDSVLVSSITVAELYAGVREGDERTALDALIGVLEVVDVTAEIACVGGLYRRDYGKSHGVGLADALIAASAESQGASLVTLNARHFPMLRGVVVPYEPHSLP
jgi:predicted nucleic acid-binding protein